jgi:excisionase family DNA binding protein
MNSDLLLTPGEAAQYLRCSKVFLWKQRRKGNLAALRAGVRKVLFRKSDLDQFLKKEYHS